MLRSTLNIATLFLIGAMLVTAGLMLSFFASPEAVRNTSPEQFESQLLNRLFDQ